MDYPNPYPAVLKAGGEFWPLPSTEVGENRIRYSPVTAQGSMMVQVESPRTHGYMVIGPNPPISELNLVGTTRSFEVAEPFYATVFDVASPGLYHGSQVVTQQDLTGRSVQMLITDPTSQNIYRVPLKPPAYATNVNASTATAIQIPRIDVAREAWLKDVYAKVKGFVTLKKNWDTYAANRISLDVIARALGVASQLAFAENAAAAPLAARPRVAPMSSGGILFELKNGKRELQIEVPPGKTRDYAVLQVSVDRSGIGNEKECTIPETSLPEVLSWVFQTS